LTLYVFVNHEWSRRDLAALSVFGGDEAIFALSAPFFLQRLVYNDHTRSRAAQSKQRGGGAIDRPPHCSSAG